MPPGPREPHGAPWWQSLPGDEVDPLADFRRGMEAVRSRVVCRRWWDSPGDESFPTLAVQERMEHAAAWRLAQGERPWRVARALGRDWPRWRRLVPELVRAVLEAAGGRRAA